MLENLIYFSPMLVLLTAFFVLVFGDHEEEYNCFRFSRIMLSLGLVLTIVFYNKATLPDWTSGTKFSLLFDVLIYGFGLALLYPAKKWYAAMSMPAYMYCGNLVLGVLCGSLLVCSINLVLTAVCCVLIMGSNYAMLRQNLNKKDLSFGSRMYLCAMVGVIAVLAAALMLLYQKCGSLMYADVYTYMEVYQDQLITFVLAAMLVVVFMFLLAAAPLHFWFTEVLGQTILPVFAYFITVPVIASLAGFISLNVAVLQPLLPQLRFFYIATALLSVGVGAIGSCSGKNIYKMFAYGAVYHFGIIFLAIRKFTVNAVNSGFIYFFVYLLTMYGVCMCLHGFKRKGENLVMLSEFEGAAYKRPYISAVMTIFVFSLLGMPPFFGFLGVFSVLNYLALHHHFYQLIYILSMMLIIGYSYLQVVKTIYLEEPKTSFDRVDSGTYTAILLLIVLMMFVMLNPYYVAIDFKSMLEVVF